LPRNIGLTNNLTNVAPPLRANKQDLVEGNSNQTATQLHYLPCLAMAMKPASYEDVQQKLQIHANVAHHLNHLEVVTFQ
jgi:hypothetical protein